MLRKTILLNINGPPLVSNISELQSVFNDANCKDCHDCMDNAIKAYNNHIRMQNNRPSAEELRDDLTNEVNVRIKRDLMSGEKIEFTPKKTKSKKNKPQKTVTVTKYNVDNEVYALKVKETHVSVEKQDGIAVTTCQVYSVKKSFPCESLEGDALLSSVKRKTNKKKIKREQKNTFSSTVKSPTRTSVFKKREVDNTEVPDNSMSSIEDIY
jgi:hypothetical protein